MHTQRLKGLVRGWKNEVNRLEEMETELKTSTIIETLNRCINDIEILILRNPFNDFQLGKIE